ncbi:MAG: LysM peptidoglycan-binding domain-containing protein [Spartobacteria bacterium]|nr:LysM peptidoglycan-binding domain-containing protein [Spartobacteria bacterium]
MKGTMKTLHLKTMAFSFVAAAMIPAWTGCQSLYQERAEQEMRAQQDFALLRDEMFRLKGRVETLELEVSRLDRDIYTTQATAGDAARQETQTLGARLADLERQIDAVEGRRQKDKQEIVDTLSRKIAEVMKKSAGSRSSGSASRKRGSAEYGYEHVVEPGQTLSEIASAYGVSVKAIVEENNITNPNTVRAGQKLFIPE